jgi:two-component system, OmpR family, sensor histidine kinase ChvG
MSKAAERRGKRRPRFKKRWGPFSPLMVRIMAVNVIAFVMLVAGIFYLDKFRDRLIEQRVQTLNVQAEIIAGAIGESASGGPDTTSIDVASAQKIIGRLIGPTQTRARLFTVAGDIAADSRFMSLGRSVYVVPLPPPGSAPGIQERAIIWFNRVLDRLATKEEYLPYPESPELKAGDFEEVISALAGEARSMIRQSDNGQVIITAVPVQRFRRVLGALLLTAETTDIQTIIKQERLTLLQVMTVTLIVTLLLSFFLAGTIATPIRRLATAADEIRKGIGRSKALREFSSRRDEIGDLSYALSDMTKALHNRIDAIETFAADVAHEIKNPLSSVRSAVETIQKTGDTKIQQQLLAIIEQDTKRIDRLISDISAASRLDAELSRAESAKVDFSALIETIVDAYQSTPNKNKVTFIFKKPGKPICVKGIESRLGQVVRNLLDNAISFSPEGGHITIIVTHKKSMARLTIEDEGPGLPTGVVDKIFERFYSERPSGEAFGQHSGLGLNISKQIVEAHSGTISAANRSESSKDGKCAGAIFTVSLPG